MPSIQLKFIRSDPFVAGNAQRVSDEHEAAVNAYLATFADPQNILQVTHSTDTFRNHQYRYSTTVVYYQP